MAKNKKNNNKKGIEELQISLDYIKERLLLRNELQKLKAFQEKSKNKTGAL